MSYQFYLMLPNVTTLRRAPAGCVCGPSINAFRVSGVYQRGSEQQDLYTKQGVAVTVEAAAMAGVPLAGTEWIPGQG